jgi:hypothetical protein
VSFEHCVDSLDRRRQSLIKQNAIA